MSQNSEVCCRVRLPERRPIARAFGIAALCGAAALGQGAREARPEPGAESFEQVRGITLSTHRGNREWSSDALAPTFERIRGVGANWVAIHPYASVSDDGTVRRWEEEAGVPTWLSKPIAQAHRLGLRILIKPHLAYWRSRFAWRGEIEFESDEQWQRFWAGYEAWIVDLARLSRSADAFVVGTELDRTLHQEARWRRVIDRVRDVSDVPLTYASNWTDYERVPFWDSLDMVGVQAYFPLTDSEAPTRGELEASWARLSRRLSEFGAARGKRVLLTELGYNRSFAAAREPWSNVTDGEEAEALQALCLEVALAAVEREPRIAGAFLWKWFLEPRSVGRDFQMASPTMRRVIGAAWQSTRR